MITHRPLYLRPVIHAWTERGLDAPQTAVLSTSWGGNSRKYIPRVGPRGGVQAEKQWLQTGLLIDGVRPCSRCPSRTLCYLTGVGGACRPLGDPTFVAALAPYFRPTVGMAPFRLPTLNPLGCFFVLLNPAAKAPTR